MRTDLSKYSKGEPRALWDELKPTQKASLGRLVYEMRGGDAIYAKQGPQIIDKGIVQGVPGQRAYKFDSQYRITVPNGIAWAHQVPVLWVGMFSEFKMLLGGEQVTVKELSADEVARLEATIHEHDIPTVEDTADRLIEDAYYRETPARLKRIVPRHKILSNQFCDWLKSKHGLTGVQEHQYVDVRFTRGEERILAELKVCLGVGTTKAIREALGQLLEYNHYPMRTMTDQWFVVLDAEPTSDDKAFVSALRTNRALPLFVGWQQGTEFSFHPSWPS